MFYNVLQKKIFSYNNMSAYWLIVPPIGAQSASYWGSFGTWTFFVKTVKIMQPLLKETCFYYIKHFVIENN